MPKMTWTENHTKLSDTLASLYLDKESAVHLDTYALKLTGFLIIQYKRPNSILVLLGYSRGKHSERARLGQGVILNRTSLYHDCSALPPFTSLFP
jgi:hypothetical protein